MSIGALALPCLPTACLLQTVLTRKPFVLGEGPTDNAHNPSCVKAVEAYDKNFDAMNVETVNYEDHISIIPTDELGVTVTFLIMVSSTKDSSGKMHQAPFAEVADAVKTTHAIKWNINYWSPDVKPGGIYNVPIQIVPQVNPLTLRKGDTYRIRVYKDGKPYANGALIKDVINDLTNESTADADGYATVTVSANGLNVVGVEVAGEKEDEHTTPKYFSSLSFIIDPE